MTQPGLVSVTYRALTVREIIDLARAAELVGIEWGSDVHVPVGDLRHAELVRDATVQAGLQVASYGSYFRANDDSFAEVLHTAIALGASNVRVWAGQKGSALTESEERAEIVRRLRDACRLAEPYHVTVSVEFHPHTLTDELNSTLRLRQEVSCSNLRLYWQPEPDRSPLSRMEELRQIRPWLSNLHVFQWTRSQGETLRHPLSEGAREWQEALQLASNAQFALLEFVPNDDPDLLLGEAQTLRSWLQSTP